MVSKKDTNNTNFTDRIYGQPCNLTMSIQETDIGRKFVDWTMAFCYSDG